MRILALLMLLSLGLFAPVLPAGAQPAGCTETANVSWETNWDDVTVEAAIVHVPGCADGDEVGIQLLTDDGDLPDEPIVGQVQDEHVRFDLASLDVGIEPVTGVRVLLYGETIIEIVHIDVEQRFFSQGGNEQRGLLRTTELEVPMGGQYHVPGAPTRYEVAACADMRWTAPDDLVGQGAGTFTATEAGRHVVCYQQDPGASGGPPDGEEPGVVDGTDVLGNEVVAPGTVAPSPGTGGLLASTGANLLVLGVAALFLVAAGRRLSRLRATSQGR